jgi:hypothetical protein
VVSFICGGNRSIDLSQVTDKLCRVIKGLFFIADRFLLFISVIYSIISIILLIKSLLLIADEVNLNLIPDKFILFMSVVYTIVEYILIEGALLVVIIW